MCNRHVALSISRGGAVHAVGGAHDCVVLPARAVAVFPVAALGLGEAVTIRERLGIAPEKPQAVEEIAHLGSPLAIVRFVTRFPWSSCGGLGREPRYSARSTERKSGV